MTTPPSGLPAHTDSLAGRTPVAGAEEAQRAAMHEVFASLAEDAVRQWLELIPKQQEPVPRPPGQTRSRYVRLEDQSADDLVSSMRSNIKTVESSLKDLSRSEDDIAQSVAHSIASEVGDLDTIASTLEDRLGVMGEQIGGATQLTESVIMTAWPSFPPKEQLEVLTTLLYHAPSQSLVGSLLAKLSPEVRQEMPPDVWDRAIGWGVPNREQIADRLCDLVRGGWTDDTAGLGPWLHAHIAAEPELWQRMIGTIPRVIPYLRHLGVSNVLLADLWRNARHTPPGLLPQGSVSALSTYLGGALQLGPWIDLDQDVLSLLAEPAPTAQPGTSASTRAEGRFALLRQLFTTAHTLTGEQIARILVDVRSTTVAGAWEAHWTQVSARLPVVGSAPPMSPQAMATAIRPLLSDPSPRVREVGIRLIGAHRQRLDAAASSPTPTARGTPPARTA